MTAKHLRVIAIGVVVLLILWGASERWSRPADTTPAVLRLPVSAPDDVDTVAITEGADSVLLAKQPSGAWTVNRHPASASGVSDLFQALRDSVRPEARGAESIVVRPDGCGLAREPATAGQQKWQAVGAAVRR